MKYEKILLDALIHIKDTPVEDRRDTGLCCLVEEYLVLQFDDADPIPLHIESDLLPELFAEWPEYSGSPNFPVPGGTSAYFGQHRWHGEYGAARERLLNWLIQRLQHE